tara:strand:+ start:295 stop:657 length:363 start_codon:yes stop_codon:yes gene_type:complete
MTNLNPTTENFKIANYNFCKWSGIFQDRLRVLIPITKKDIALELFSKFPKYCKVKLSETTVNNDDKSSKCFALFAEYYNVKNFIDKNNEIKNGVINKSAIKRSLKILQILKENNIKSFEK